MSEFDVAQVTAASLVPISVMLVNLLIGGGLLDFGPIPQGMELACPP